MKIKKLIWIFALLMVLLVTPIAGQRHQYFIDGDIYSFDPRITEWYVVEDWELEVCRKQGGTLEPYEVDNGPTYLSQTTVTLQGQKSEELPDETIMYEVGYYMEDALNRILEFAVRLKSATGEYYRIVGRTSLGANEAMSDYKSVYLGERYTHVELAYVVDGSRKMTIVRVPIVDNAGQYYSSKDYGYADDNSIDWGGW